jgi:hypothetical protein
MFRTINARSCLTGATLVTSSGYMTRPPRTRGRHRRQPPPGRLLLRRRLALGGSAVLLATLIVSVGAVVRWAAPATVSPPTALPETTIAAGPPPPSVEPPSPSSPPIATPAPFAVDERGFVNTEARCEASQTAVVIGRTRGSLVVICGDHYGRYGYRGVRLSDDAVLTTAARTTSTHEFIAQNANVTYSISPAELRITVGGAVLKQEPMIDYRGPRP